MRLFSFLSILVASLLLTSQSYGQSQRFIPLDNAQLDRGYDEDHLNIRIEKGNALTMVQKALGGVAPGQKVEATGQVQLICGRDEMSQDVCGILITNIKKH